MVKKNIAPYLITFIIMVLVFHKTGYSATSEMVIFQNGSQYNSDNIYQIGLALSKKYPNLIEMEVLGYSYDKKPIYALRMSDNINLHDESTYVSKQHFLVHSGLHARETYNPFVVMKIIEDYINDYYDDDYLKFVNMKELLKNNVIHFIPLSNPDGFDIVKRGPNTLKDKDLKEYFKSIITGNYHRLKANARGVDLNRNFENFTLNKSTEIWVDDVGKKQRNAIVRPLPSLDFFHGKKQGSEKETQILQNYFLKYDFRVYMSYHSMGRIVYGHTTRFGPQIQNLIEKYVKVATSTSGYGRASDLPQINSWGYEDRFVNANTSKPLITIETLSTNVFPTPSKYYKSEYEKYNLNRLPVAFIRKSQQIGYFDHKLYKDGKYVRDFVDLDYANANAKRMGGLVLSYKGKPLLYQDVSEIPSEEIKVQSEPIETLEELDRGLIIDTNQP